MKLPDRTTCGILFVLSLAFVAASCATKPNKEEEEGLVASPIETPSASGAGEVIDAAPEGPGGPILATVTKAEKPKEAPKIEPEKPVEKKLSPTELAKTADAKVKWSSSEASLREGFTMSGKAADEAPTDSAIALQHARHALRLAQTATGLDQPAQIAKEGLASMDAAGLSGDSLAAVPAYYRASLTGLVMQSQGLGAAGKLPQLEAQFKRSLSAPGTEEGGPWRAIGMLYLKAPAWPTGIGDIELALENLEKAVQSYGGFPHNHICLARALADDGSLEEAKRSLAQAENLLASGNWGALETGWRREIAEIRKLLA